MMLEKKMIVGSALKAKLISPTWKPTSGTNDLKRKSPPASEKLMILLITLSKKPKTGFPNGVLSMQIANNHCSPSPHPISRKFILERLLDNPSAIDNNKKIPRNPVILSIMI